MYHKREPPGQKQVVGEFDLGERNEKGEMLQASSTQTLHVVTDIGFR